MVLGRLYLISDYSIPIRSRSINQLQADPHISAQSTCKYSDNMGFIQKWKGFLTFWQNRHPIEVGCDVTCDSEDPHVGASPLLRMSEGGEEMAEGVLPIGDVDAEGGVDFGFV